MESRKTINIPQHPAAVMNAARQVAMNPPKGFTLGQIIDHAYAITMTRGMSMASWGENITIQVYAGPHDDAILDIVSKPAMPTQIVDWGRGNGNVATLADAIMIALGYPGAPK
ncbi:MAG: hypothetical protein FWD55_08140 [Propionibacteriaceae bacterium]|nr:hypothetical protein [Propionibacteriaceae bacterium]